MSLRDDILTMVRRRDYVSFAELSRLQGFNGDLEVQLLPNVVLWSGISQEAADALQSLQRDRLIHPVGASVLTYVVDGALLKLPIAKRPRRTGYKMPHWAPVCFRPGVPAPMKQGRSAGASGGANLI